MIFDKVIYSWKSNEKWSIYYWYSWEDYCTLVLDYDWCWWKYMDIDKYTYYIPIVCILNVDKIMYPV